MAPTIPADRLSRLVPRLASNHDGEVVATARAIGRTLQSAGADWHDLAAFLSSKPQRPLPRPAARKAPRWYSLNQRARVDVLKRLIALHDLSPWELSFVASISGRLSANPEAWLSSKQIAVLDRLLGVLAEVEDGQ